MDSIFYNISTPNEEIYIEFSQHLQNGKSLVRGRQIPVTDVVIAEVFGLPTEGPVWASKWLKLHDVIEAFRDEGQELIKKGKGI